MSVLVVRALGMVTVQDLGRPGRMHEGLAPGGALVPELLVAANRAAGNADGAAALEVLGHLVVRAERELTMAIDEHARVLHPGDELTIASGARRVAYLAVRGGIDAPVILGGRGAQLSAGLGSLVRAGDRIDVGATPRARHGDTGARAADAAFFEGDRIRILPGPDVAAFTEGALDVLCGAPFEISATSDRVGTRLAGPTIPRRAEWVERSRPMVRGAIEVPRDGQPIVLGPEHPTTGGYPVIAVVAQSDLGRLFARRPGASVTFFAAD